MTTEDPGRETQVVAVRDRNIVVRKLTDGQLLLMAREAKILQRDDISTDRKLDGIDRVFRILESGVVQAADREFLEELMLVGELDVRELMSFVTAFKEDEALSLRPKVRRGRAPVKR
jgi:hypothetical protein